MAKVIERVLRSHPGQWAALKKLGNVTGHTEAGMFARWLSQVESVDRPLVEDLADAFGLPIANSSSGVGTNAPPAVTEAPGGTQVSLLSTP